jgi:N-acetyl-anhydromuramyl-L-alanine amidase AmpD
MVQSKLTATARPSKQRSSRNGARIDHVILHHGATTNSDWMIDAMVSGSKQVSANYVCRANGDLVSVVPEEDRAWTSSSASWDRRSITVECANLSTNGWTISPQSHEALAQLCADVATRYGFKLTRDSVLGHRELNQRYGASYATACPGAMDLDWIVTRANEILAGHATPEAPTTETEDDDVSFAEQIDWRGGKVSAAALIVATAINAELAVAKVDALAAKLAAADYTKHGGIDAPNDVVDADTLKVVQQTAEKVDKLLQLRAETDVPSATA